VEARLSGGTPGMNCGPHTKKSRTPCPAHRIRAAVLTLPGTQATAKKAFFNNYTPKTPFFAQVSFGINVKLIKFAVECTLCNTINKIK
jgi:hypothetical protein